MTMKAQCLEAFNTPYKLRDLALPELDSARDVLIKVDAASYCHTDAVLAAGQMPPFPPSFPLIGCHEFSGTIVAVHPGGGDDAAAFAIGDRVAVCCNKYHACGVCEECLDESRADSDPAGYSTYCPVGTISGISRDGGFAEYAVVDREQLVRIPAGLSAVDTAPLMCAGVTIYAAIKKSGLRAGQSLGIIGCGGGLGHLGLQFAAEMGYEVWGVDNADGPLALARSLVQPTTTTTTTTTTRIVDSRVESAEQIVRQIGSEKKKRHRGEMGLDAVIVLPESQAAFDYGVQLLKDHGRCVVVSFPQAGFHLSSYDVVFRDVSVVGSLFASHKVAAEMLAFAAQHHVKATLKTYALRELNELVAEYHRGAGGKLVVDMSLDN